jgi:hypothetical protein
MLISGQNNNQTTSAAVGQPIIIQLSWIGPDDGYDGTPPLISSDAVVFVNETTPQGQNPGGPTEDYHFSAAKPGTATIVMTYTGWEWDAGYRAPQQAPRPESAFRITVTVSQ